MFDTSVTIIGNALNTPEWRRLEHRQTVVARFKVAATSRRYDRNTGRWVDGASLRVRVNCWRRLAENVCSSVISGDPVVVTGRLYTRDWIGEDGQHRSSYELDAMAVGHDLSRGRSSFVRQRKSANTTVVEDDFADLHVEGEVTAVIEGTDSAGTTTVKVVPVETGASATPVSPMPVSPMPVSPTSVGAATVGTVSVGATVGETSSAAADTSHVFDPSEEAMEILRGAGLNTEVIETPPAELAEIDEIDDPDEDDDDDEADDLIAARRRTVLTAVPG